MKSWHLAMVAAVAGLAVAGCSSDPAGGSKDGPAIFQSLCATCHGPDGKPPAAMAARLGVRDLTAPEFRARVSLGAVEQQVRHGSQNKLMPAFEGAISDAQIRAVAEFVAAPQFAPAPSAASAPSAPSAPAAPRARPAAPR